MSFINTNLNPYYDDYSEDKKFYRILFKPGVALQARELTQLQTIIQKQIERFGKHIFKDGAMVIPGLIKYDLNYKWVKIVGANYNAGTAAAIEANWLGKRVICDATGVQGTIVNYSGPDDTGIVVLFIKYEKANSIVYSGNALGTIDTFLPGNTFHDVAGAYSAFIDLPGSGPNDATVGIGSVATIDRGVYFVRGFFVLVDKQTILLDPFGTTPSYKVGLTISEEIITPQIDESIKDLAQGTPNYAAPGADRYYIELVLSKVGVDADTGSDFIELLRLRDGVEEARVQYSEYSVLNDTLARRTSEESGDYTVRPFFIDVLELYKENNNHGRLGDDALACSGVSAALALGAKYGITGTHTLNPVLYPQYADKVFPGDDHPTMQAQLRTWCSLKIDPGLAYVQGNRIETYQQFVDFPKARDASHVAFQSTTTINTPIGSYLNVTLTKGLPDVNSCELVNLYDQISNTQDSTRLLGTARVKAIEGIGGSQYKLYLFDINLAFGKSLHSLKTITSQSISGDDPFIAHVVLEETLVQGSSVSLASGSQDIYGTGTNWVSVESQALANRDIIKVFDTSNAAHYLEISNVLSDAHAQVSAVITPAVVSNSSYYYCWAKVYDPDINALIFPLSHSKIKDIRGADSVAVPQIFETRRRITAVASGTSVTFNLTPGSGENFPSFDSELFLCARQSTGDIIALSGGNCVVTSTAVTVSGVVNLAQYELIAPIRMLSSPASLERQKTLVQNASVISANNDQNLSTISLGKVDIWKLVKVTMSANFTTTPIDTDTDITSRYELDNGQRDNYYGVGKITLKPGQLAPTGKVKAIFHYFSHGSSGQYFSVNSYPDASTTGGAFDYKDIPTYISKETGGTYTLRDCLDFRTRKLDNDSGFVTSGYDTPLGDFLASYHYYLNRIDLLCLKSSKDFIIQRGAPALDPVHPKVPENSMLLWELWIEGYTGLLNEVNKTYVENKRYTMRDIGKLEGRIENIEKYTALTLLEKDTNDQSITDDSGLERTKNGFAVDNFRTYPGLANTSSPEFKCSFDLEQGRLRSQFQHDQIKLIEDEVVTGAATPDDVRNARSYKKYGDLFTVTRLADGVVAKQALASRTESINPFDVQTFVGRLTLNPAFDEWKETQRAPSIIIQQEGDYAEMETLANSLGTVWNEWETTWTGKPHKSSTKKTVGKFYGPNSPNAGHNHNWPITKFIEKTTTTTTQSTQTREGIYYDVIPSVVQTSLGDKVIDVSWVPFIRSQRIHVTGKAFMPYAKLNAFFDTINVNELCCPLGGNYGDSIVANNKGQIDITFWIPGTHSLSEWTSGAIVPWSRVPASDAASRYAFKTGERKLVLTTADNLVGIPVPTTYAEANYRAQGLLETVQESILSTRNAELVAHHTSESKNVTETSIDQTLIIKQEDPLAESFLVDKQTGGCFLSKIDVYFSQKPDTLHQVPVKLQIRPLDTGGQPSNLLLPMAEVVKEWSDINTTDVDLVNNRLVINGVPGLTGSLPVHPSESFAATSFEFESPIYVKENEDYCIVLISDSKEYRVWVAEHGSDSGGDGSYLPADEAGAVARRVGESGAGSEILDEPYKNGVLFKSSNGRTWNPDQKKDLMFTIWKAQFDTSATGLVTFTNTDVPPVLLGANPIITKSGSSLVRVLHADHGHTTTQEAGLIDTSNPQYVFLTGVVGPINNIPASSINGLHRIVYADLDSYVIESGTIATASGQAGGANVVASQNRAFDTFMPTFGTLQLPDTTLSFGLKLTGGLHSATQMILDSSYSDTSIGENISLNSSALIASPINETYIQNQDAGRTGPNRSIFIRASLRTSNPNLSPILDIQRMNLICVHNRIANTTAFGTSGALNISSSNFDRTTIISALSLSAQATLDCFYVPSGGVQSTADALKNIVVGKYIETTGFANSANNGKFKVLGVKVPGTGITGALAEVYVESALADETHSASLYQWDKFVDEVSPKYGTEYAKYPIKTITLEQPSNALYIKFAAIRLENTYIDVYYKTLKVGDQDSIDDKRWTKVNPVGDILVSQRGQFRDYEYDLKGLDSFTGAAVKLVFRSDNPASVPEIKDFRVIALEE